MKTLAQQYIEADAKGRFDIYNKEGCSHMERHNDVYDNEWRTYFTDGSSLKCTFYGHGIPAKYEEETWK